MKIIGSPRESAHRVADQGDEEGCGHMATEHDYGTCFCMYDGSVNTGMKFFLFHVSDTVTEEMKKQSMIPYRKKRSPPPNADLNPFGTTQLGYGTSFVSVGSMLYCIGGLKADKNTGNKVSNGGGHKNTGFEYGKEVRKFDIKISEFEQVDNQMPPPMNEARCFPAVVAIGNIIYVFDGLKPRATEPSSWAECLNTDMPIAMQKWMPLKQPPFTLRLTSFSFAIPYGTDSILIADRKISEGALLYNVRDESWMKYEPSFRSHEVCAPVSVVCEKTIYWIGKLCIYAYDYDKHIYYSGLLREILYEKDFDYVEPYLMHLKDDIFCCFTLYAVYDHRGSQTIAVQCTTFQVTKISYGYGQGKLHLRAMGYKSYKCGTVFSLRGVVSIQTRICFSETKKHRSSVKKKKWRKEKEMAQSHLAVPE